MGTANTAEFFRLLDASIDKTYWDRFKELLERKNYVEMLFDKKDSNKLEEQYYEVGAVPNPERFQGRIQYQGVTPGYLTTCKPLEYAGGITIERRLWDTDQSGVIKKMSKGLATAAHRKKMEIAHEPFTSAFSTAYTFMTSEEGVSLCSNSHTTKVPGVSTSAGFDNYSTLSLDAPNLETIRIQSRGFKNDIGKRLDTNFDTIIHGTNLAAEVWEIQNSQLVPGETSNTANFQRGRWKNIELPLLDDTDTNNFFIVDSEMMKECLVWLEGVPLEFNRETDFDSLVRKYADYFVDGWCFTSWRWCLGCEVT